MTDLPKRYTSRLPKVIEFDPVGVICIYRVVLSCGHVVSFKTKTNYVPKRMKCEKCNQIGRDEQSTLNLLGYLPWKKKKRKK